MEYQIIMDGNKVLRQGFCNNLSTQLKQFAFDWLDDISAEWAEDLSKEIAATENIMSFQCDGHTYEIKEKK